MVCPLTSILVGVKVFAAMYTVCVYRCPEPSQFYHYPYSIIQEYGKQCLGFMVIDD